MRIIISTHNVCHGDGQGRICFEIARCALSSGIEVILIADVVDNSLIELGALWTPVKVKSSKLILFKVWEFARRADLNIDHLRRETDIINAWGYTTTRMHHVNGVQFVHSAWGKVCIPESLSAVNLNAHYQRLFTMLNARWERLALTKSLRIITPSYRTKAELAPLGIHEESIQVIRNGSDPKEFFPARNKNAESASPAPRSGLTALFVGDIKTYRKNLDSVLRALVSCRDIHLVVVGDLQDSPFISLARRLGVASRVKFLGYRKDIAEIMRNCDLFVFPSRYEPFGIVVLESMLTEIPVITASTVGASEIMTPDSGIVVQDPDDCIKIANAMNFLLENKDRRCQMGVAARRVGLDLTWEKMAAEYLGVFRDVQS